MLSEDTVGRVLRTPTLAGEKYMGARCSLASATRTALSFLDNLLTITCFFFIRVCAASLRLALSVITQSIVRGPLFSVIAPFGVCLQAERSVPSSCGPGERISISLSLFSISARAQRDRNHFFLGASEKMLPPSVDFSRTTGK